MKLIIKLLNDKQAEKSAFAKRKRISKTKTKKKTYKRFHFILGKHTTKYHENITTNQTVYR